MKHGRVQRLCRIGLTGGIGSGKSTFGQMLVAQGAALADADRISRDLTAPNGLAIERIRKVFGDSFLAPGGALNRDAMRLRIFEDATAKRTLESIIHPLVGEEIQRVTLAAQESSATLLVLDIPLLAESLHWPPQFDAIVVVDCTEETQISRVQLRSGLSREAVQRVIAAQASRPARRELADIVVYNEGISMTELLAQARQTAALFGL